MTDVVTFKVMRKESRPSIYGVECNFHWCWILSTSSRTLLSKSDAHKCIYYIQARCVENLLENRKRRTGIWEKWWGLSFVGKNVTENADSHIILNTIKEVNNRSSVNLIKNHFVNVSRHQKLTQQRYCFD